MAHTKAKGSTKLGRESESKRLGVKRSDGQAVNAGEVVIRQRGTKYHPGTNVKMGADDTIYALIKGTVKFATKKKMKYDGSRKTIKVVSVLPIL